MLARTRTTLYATIISQAGELRNRDEPKNMHLSETSYLPVERKIGRRSRIPRLPLINDNDAVGCQLFDSL